MLGGRENHAHAIAGRHRGSRRQALPPTAERLDGHRTYSTATTIPPAFRRAGPWTASSSTTTGQGTRRSLSATRLRFLWYEIRTGQTLTDGDGPVQFGTKSPGERRCAGGVF